MKSVRKVRSTKQPRKDELEGIGARLRKLREGKGVMQTQLANALGWGQSKVSKIERGQLNLTIIEFLQILWAMKCTRSDARYVLYNIKKGSRVVADDIN